MDVIDNEAMRMRAQQLIEAPGRLREWLATKPPELAVGVRRDPSSCPVQQFLEENGVLAMVYENHVSLRGVPIQVGNPEWLASFVAVVDGSGMPFAAVRAGDALTMLDATTKGEGA